MEEFNDDVSLDDASMAGRLLIWRKTIPEAERMQEALPRMLQRGDERRVDNVPQFWKDMVCSMRTQARAQAESATEELSELPLEVRRGVFWSRELLAVEDMLSYLTRTIRDELGCEDGETVPSLALLAEGMRHVRKELEGPAEVLPMMGALEADVRMFRALQALSPHFDDRQLKRVRALHLAEVAASSVSVPTAEALDSLVAEEGGDADDEVASRMRAEQLKMVAMRGVLFRGDLAGIDDAFGSLDPLVVMEEFSDATPEGAGGRAQNGAGRTGSARALASLAVSCCALGFEQRTEESFDEAVERARTGLLMARSRVRKWAQGFSDECSYEAG